MVLLAVWSHGYSLNLLQWMSDPFTQVNWSPRLPGLEISHIQSLVYKMHSVCAAVTLTNELDPLPVTLLLCRLEVGVLPGIWTPARVFTSHNELKQLAGVRFILGVGKNPVYFCDRGLILSPHTCICSCSPTVKVCVCFRDVQLEILTVDILAADVTDDSVAGCFVNLSVLDRINGRYILFFCHWWRAWSVLLDVFPGFYSTFWAQMFPLISCGFTAAVTSWSHHNVYFKSFNSLFYRHESIL